MKSLLSNIVWICFVTLAAATVVLAPRLWPRLSAKCETIVRQGISSTAVVVAKAGTLCTDAPADNRSRNTDALVREPRSATGASPEASPRAELDRMADDPREADAATSIEDLFEADPSLDEDLRRLLSAEVELPPPDAVPEHTEVAAPVVETASVEDHLGSTGVDAMANAAEDPPSAAPPLTAEVAVTAPAEPVVVAPVAEWPRANSLETQLNALGQHAATQSWAESVLGELDRLHATTCLGDPEAAAILQRLVQLTEAGEDLAERLPARELRIPLLRAGYALARRLAIWRPVHANVAAGTNGLPASQLDGDRLREAIERVESLVGRSEHRSGWSQFLLLDELREVSASEDLSYGEARRVARIILDRLSASRLSESQREFLDDEQVRPLRHQLLLWAAEPVDYVHLLNQLEAFEDAPTGTAGNAVADGWNRLRWAPHKQTNDLSKRLDTYYRNANIRLAVSGTLLNRLLPIVQDMDEEVDDFVLGNRVVGESRTSTRLYVRLIPDKYRWRLGLEARGRVNSETLSDVGSVRVFNRGESSYLARKLLMVGRQGLRMEESEADANAATQLIGIRTNVDTIPLVSQFVRGMVRSQHDSQRYAAEREVEHKVEVRVRRRFDEEVRGQLAKAERNLERRVLAPLRELELNPVATDMMTTQKRLIMRCRLAGYEQLAANTPRPRAPADSLLSVQIHQSAANNVIDQLDLDGNEFELQDLYRYLSGKFQDGPVPVPEKVPQGVTVRFADKEAVRLHFENGRAMLSIRIAQLKNGRSCWKNFEVRGFYRPDPTSRNADLIRDGSIQLVGNRIRLGDRIFLAGIFSAVLSDDRPLPLIDQRFVDHPRLQDVRLTQFAVTDGWIGIALASRPERRDLVARPETEQAERR
jgi:hypothetical protein